MDAVISSALSLTDGSSIDDRTVDITTRGARSSEPRRIEIWFHNVGGDVYLTGTPGARSWYANLLANPQFTFHLKHGVQADLPATATPITEPGERDPLFRAISAGIDALYSDGRQKPPFPPVEEWIATSPLVRVTFE